MARRKAFIKMKKKPEKPKRKNNMVSFYPSYNESLDLIAKKFLECDIHPADVQWDGQYFCGMGSEPEEEFNKRLKDYEEKFAKYNEWYESNQDLIEKELEARAEDAKKKAALNLERQRKRFQKEKEQHEKKIAVLQKKLAKFGK